MRRLWVTTVGILVVLICSTTNCVDECAPEYIFYPPTRYKVDMYARTAKGIEFDPSDQIINPARIDRLVDETEQCLIDTFGNPPVMPPDVARDAHCPHPTFNLPPRRHCIKVKFPSWVLNCDQTQQVLPVYAFGGACEAKGQVPTEECPCRYRAFIQQNQTIVTTPSMYLFKDYLVRIITGCDNPWASPQLAKCVTPTTGPLDDGSGP